MSSGEPGGQAGSDAARPRPSLPADPDEDIFASAEPAQKQQVEAQQRSSAAAGTLDRVQGAAAHDAAMGSSQRSLADQVYRDMSQSQDGADNDGGMDPMMLLAQQSLAASAVIGEPLQDSIMEAGLPDEEEAPLQPASPQQDNKSAGGARPSSAPASGVTSSPHCGLLQWDASADEQQDTGESGGASDMEGFLYDQTSGLLYNPAIGAYFDRAKGLFGDASSGQWYSLQDGTYHLVA